MKWMRVSVFAAGLLLAGCSATSKNVETVTLPTSHKHIDVVQHRSDVKFADCGTLVVLQTYDASGDLIDSKEARGQALHCGVIPAIIDAGGRVGAAHVGAARTNINATAGAAANAAAAGGSATATGGQGGAGGSGGAGGNGGNGGNGGGGGSDHGNNGGGNGDGDGTNGGTDHHHDNGDNN